MGRIENSKNLLSKTDNKFKKILETPLISLSVIVFVSFLIRLNYVNFEIPLALDSLEYFVYAIDTSRLGHLPETYSPSNNGWSIFLSGIFTILNFNDPLIYMQLQKLISIIISSLISISIYFLVKQFFDKKFAIIGAALFAFDPRIIENSTIGVGDQLFILLVSISLILIIQNKKFVIIAFGLIGFGTMVRPEGIFAFGALLLMYIIKNKKQIKIIPKVILFVIVFFIVLSPIMMYRNEIFGDDRIFGRASETIDFHLTYNEESERNTGINFLLTGLENFPKYLGWTMIPTMIVFVPFGMIILLREWKNIYFLILVPLISLTIPVFYVYSIPLLETRYIYFLFPMFCIIGMFTIKKIVVERKTQHIILSVIVFGILLSSLSFLEYKKIDLDDERNGLVISKFIFNNAEGVNSFQGSKFLKSVQVMENWPNLPKMYLDGHIVPEISKITFDKNESLEINLIKSKEKNLTHLVVKNSDSYFENIFENENEFSFLDKELEISDNYGNPSVKIFKINFEKLTGYGSQ